MSYRKSIDSYKILRKFYREFLAGKRLDLMRLEAGREKMKEKKGDGD